MTSSEQISSWPYRPGSGWLGDHVAPPPPDGAWIPTISRWRTGRPCCSSGGSSSPAWWPRWAPSCA